MAKVAAKAVAKARAQLPSLPPVVVPPFPIGKPMPTAIVTVFAVISPTSDLIPSRASMTTEKEPTFYAGVVVERFIDKEHDKDTLSLSITSKIYDGVLESFPGLIEGEQPKFSGKTLIEELRKLRLVPKEERPKKMPESARQYGSITGKLRWYLKILAPLNWMVHRLSTCTAAPPEGGLDVAKSVLAVAYRERHTRITYRRGLPNSDSLLQGSMSARIEPDALPPSTTTAVADATWGIDIEGPFTCGDVYGLAVTRCGAHVYATTHNLGVVVDASSFAEAIATGRAGEIIEEARAIETALGIPPDKPTLVMTDNKANALVGSGAGTLRSRHAIRRWVTFLQRVQTGACILRFVPDEQNPADFLTKPVPAAKLETSKLWLQGKPPKSFRV